MWRVLRLVRPHLHTTARLYKAVPSNVKLTAKVAGAAFLLPNLVVLDVPKVPIDSPSIPPPTKLVAGNSLDDLTLKKEAEQGWNLTITDAMHVTKLLLVGGLVWGITGSLLGGALFRACTLAGYHLSRLISIPVCILSGAMLSTIGLHRGIGHSLIYLINKGLAGHVLKKVIPLRVGDASIIHWDAAVNRVTYSFKVKAAQSGFFTALALKSLAKRLEAYLLLVKDEDKLLKQGTLTENVISRKLTKVIKRQMRKPVYIAGVIYGAAVTTVAILVWRS